MATETVIYVSLALVLLTRIYVFISPPDFLQEHQDPHYQEYHLYRQYHIRKQKKQSSPTSASNSTAASDHNLLPRPTTPRIAEYKDGHGFTPSSLSPLHVASTTSATATQNAAVAIPSSPSTSSLLSTLSQRNASNVTLVPPKEPVPLKPLSTTYASSLSPPQSSSSTEQYVLERFAHHAPHEELLLVGVGPGTLPLPSHLYSQAQPQDHTIPHPIPRHASDHATQPTNSSMQYGEPEETDDSDWSEVQFEDESYGLGSGHDRYTASYYFSGGAGGMGDHGHERTPSRRGTFDTTMPPIDPSPLSTLVYDTPKHLSPSLGPSSPSQTPPHAPPSLDLQQQHNHHQHHQQQYHHHDFEARVRSLMQTMNLEALKPPSYLSLPISDIDYSISATSHASSTSGGGGGGYHTAPETPSSEALTAQFDADPDLQAQIATLLSQRHHRHGDRHATTYPLLRSDDDQDTDKDEDEQSTNQDLYSLLLQQQQQQDMTVVWESNRWRCLEDNANRLLYVLRKIGWQGHVRVKVLVDRDRDSEGERGDGVPGSGSGALDHSYPPPHRRRHTRTGYGMGGPTDTEASTGAGSVVPSFIAVTEETWKAAGMEEVLLAASGEQGGRKKKGVKHKVARSLQQQHGQRAESSSSSASRSSEDGTQVDERGTTQHLWHNRHDRKKTWPLTGPSTAAEAATATAAKRTNTATTGRVRQGHRRGPLMQAESSVLQVSATAAFTETETPLPSSNLFKELLQHHQPPRQHERQERRGSMDQLLQTQRRHRVRARAEGGRWRDRPQQYHYQSSRYHLHSYTLMTKPRWEDGQDTDADADDEVDVHETLGEDGVGTDDDDDDDVLVDEEDEVDEEDHERTDGEDEDDHADAESEDQDARGREQQENADDIRLRHYQYHVHQRQKAYTRHPGIQRSHTFPHHSFSHYSFSSSGATDNTTTSTARKMTAPVAASSSTTTTTSTHSPSMPDAKVLVPLSISIPQLNGLCHLGILNRPSHSRTNESNGSSISYDNGHGDDSNYSTANSIICSSSPKTTTTRWSIDTAAAAAADGAQSTASGGLEASMKEKVGGGQSSDYYVHHELVSSPREATQQPPFSLVVSDPMLPLPSVGSSKNVAPSPLPSQTASLPHHHPPPPQWRRPRLADHGRQSSIPELALPPPVAVVVADAGLQIGQKDDGIEKDSVAGLPERRDSGHAECKDEGVWTGEIEE
ncbi:hypothetical protein BGZ73_008454 [Actinomortierella ambigua]|nr:hypothetical protein BGZ73_008454 [Actinomortierella ambigua]